MLNVSCPSGTHRAPALPATRSTKERASAPPSSDVFAPPTRPRRARYRFRRAVPSQPRHTLAPRAPNGRCPLRQSSFSSSVRVPCLCRLSGSGRPSPRPLRLPVSTRGGRTIGTIVPASRPVGRTRSASSPTEPGGFPGCQASGVQAVPVSHSHARRRSNPGMQRTRYARR